MLKLALVLLLTSGSAALADEHGLGRLFTTPGERESLDRQRATDGAASQAETTALEPADSVKSATPSTSRYTVSGLVRRSDGVDMAWVNGSVVRGTATKDGVTVMLDETASVSVPLLLPGRQRPILLKPGQVLDASTGRVSDLYVVPTSPVATTGKGIDAEEE